MRASSRRAGPVHNEGDHMTILAHIEECLRPLAVPIADLRADPANVRLHNDRNMETLRASLAAFGQQKPIVADAEGIIVAGNATLEAARALGWTHLAVVRTSLDEAGRKAFGVADNRTAELAIWNTAELIKLIDELKETDVAAAIGFSEDEIKALVEKLAAEMAPIAGLTDPDTVPEPPAEAVTQRGDLWILGDHRLLCGDSTNAADVGRVMGGEKAGLCFTSPPYAQQRDYEGEAKKLCKDWEPSNSAGGASAWKSSRGTWTSPSGVGSSSRERRPF